MTRYYFDDARQELIATWETGVGSKAARVTALPADAKAESDVLIGTAVAEQLTRLSSAAWRTYTHGGRFVEPDEANTEAWRLAEDREDFDEATALLIKPGSPHMQPYSPILASAKAAGHLLDELQSTSVTDALVNEIKIEFTAVANAELGDLTGRAAQAVALTRLAGSPTQVQAAWDLLAIDPLGCGTAMTTRLDPTSACVAAAAWLHGAATTAADESGTSRAHVIADADDIEPVPTTTPMEVLERLDTGQTPTAVVTFLIAEAQRVAEGLFPDLDLLSRRTTKVNQLAERFPDSRDALLDEAKICLLDPARPAPDLLEDLLSGIYACFLVWADLTEDQREPEGLDPCEELSPEQSAEMDQMAVEQFNDLVRIEMEDVDRLSI